MQSAQSETGSAVPAEALSAYVHDQEDAYVEFLSQLFRAESPSTDPASQEEVQRLLAEALPDLGFAVTHLSGTKTGGALYARPIDRTREQPCQFLLGHSDTVWDHGTLDEMPVVQDDDCLYGPGVFDMKAGLANIVFALRALDALDLCPTVTPLVLTTSDDEIGSPKSRRHVERLACVTERVYVLEPALGPDGKIKTARKGTGEMVLRVHPTDTAAGGKRGAGAVTTRAAALRPRRPGVRGDDQRGHDRRHPGRR